MADRKTFTGIARRHRTRLSVRLGDGAAKWFITVGGIGTIIAVLGVFVCLFYVVWPLFQSPAVQEQRSIGLGSAAAAPLRMGIDEHGAVGWTLSHAGLLQSFRTDTGESLQRRELFPQAKLTTASFLIDAPEVAVGFDDGTVRLGHIGFSTKFIEPADVPEEIRDLATGELATFQGGIIERTPQGQYRLKTVDASFVEPLRVAQAPILLIDHIRQEGRSLFCALSGDGKLRLNRVIEKRNLLTDEVTLRTDQCDLPYLPRGGRPPKHLLFTGQGESILVAWENGHAVRFDARDLSNPVVAEELDLVDDPAAKLTAIDQLNGRRTLLVGDSRGMTAGWFAVLDEEARTSDGVVWTLAHRLPGRDSAVTALGTSSRTRIALVGYADGYARLFQVTAARQLLEVDVDGPVTEATIGPKDDQLYALSGNRLWTAAFDPKHPEASWSSLFLPVWYEDAAKPQHVWQSTGGTSDFEPKLGMMPLIGGTLKATFYSMLFGAPLALLAAIYTSEFMHPRWRARIKPSIEVMASLPSVVLGFLAGIVLAPLVEGVVPELLTTFVAVPFVILLCAYLWQLLPQRRMLMWSPYRLTLIGLAIPLGVLVAWFLGPAVESALFGGDIMAWLDGQMGSGFGGWMLMLLPMSALATAVAAGVLVNPWIRRLAGPDRRKLALLNLAKFAAASVAALLLALVFSQCLSFAGFDPRGSYVDTYVQRNALIVGFMMGFAIIPIIYTIADDALSTVPDHLRSASLGAGATPWQTAMRIVVPSAMSGLFSALMIGLGRAVGETMIVLMGAGNAPVLNLNIFDGFRTLSANIAVEMPDAARDTTHYRVLFLTALTLFVITFCVNTVAEIVRLRFRRRAAQL